MSKRYVVLTNAYKIDYWILDCETEKTLRDSEGNELKFRHKASAEYRADKLNEKENQDV